jgi:hypothetical protein
MGQSRQRKRFCWDGWDTGVTPDLCFASDGWLACQICAQISPMRFSASHVVDTSRLGNKPAETCQEQIELPAKQKDEVSAEKEEASEAVCGNDLP